MDSPSVSQTSRSLEPSQPSLTHRGAWTYPEFPRSLRALLQGLETPAPGHPASHEAKALHAALRKLGVHAESHEAWDAIKTAWEWFQVLGFENHIGLIPPPLAGVSPILREWAQDFHEMECQQRLLPASRPQDDWRVKTVLWVQGGMTGDRPHIPHYRLPLPLIPEWLPNQTFLSFLPAPGMEPGWLPGVVHFPEPQDSILNRPVLLHGLDGMLLAVDELQSIAWTPPSENSRGWLLRWSALQQMAFVAES